MNILEFENRKRQNKKISVITCYDYSFAKIIADTEIDCILVGDSLAMVMHGHPTTLPASIQMMELHTTAVVRGAPNKFIIGDLPFLSYRKDLRSNVTAAGKLMQAGAQAVKLEGARGNLELIRHLVDSGIPVMGHLGLTPQSIHQLGGFRVQAKEKAAQEQLRKDCRDLQEAGCFSLVLECVPSQLAKEISQDLHIPTIGIGAGPDTDGQVLVLQDLLGMNKDFKPKFLKKYLNGYDLLKNTFNDYHQEVISQKFPSEKESY